jgi:hypothetical protein
VGAVASPPSRVPQKEKRPNCPLEFKNKKATKIKIPPAKTRKDRFLFFNKLIPNFIIFLKRDLNLFSWQQLKRHH